MTELIQKLPTGYSFRKLEKSDYNNNYRETLQVLTDVGQISESQFNELFDYWESAKVFHPHVITNEKGIVVAAGMVFFEKKLIHECSLYGHIEDIAVAKSEQGKKLGFSMIIGLSEIAEKAGCRKVILDCSAKNIGFYEKCGFKEAGHNMNKVFV